MNTSFYASERALQNNCIDLFKQLGFIFISQKESENLRHNDLSCVLFRDILRDKLSQINSFTHKNKTYTFSAHNIEHAISELDIALNEGLQKANQKITDRILLGSAYEEVLANGEKRSFSLKYIDFENLANNHFAITEEFSVLRENQGQEIETRRVDLVLLINGIPLVAIELKKSSISYENGIRQLLKEQQKGEIQKLFKFIQITLAGNTHEAKYATTLVPEKFYSTWRENDAKDEAKAREYLSKLISNREITRLDLTLFGLLRKDRILKLIKHYVFFDGGIKKICRYQQFFAIEKTLKRIERFSENGVREGGLIWHTQGSGKSLTMVILAKLIKLKIPACKVIIVSDRKDLDRQLSETFRASEMEVKRAESGKDLLNSLKSGASVITTLVHKFETLHDVKSKDLHHTDFYNNANIFVLVDESHRTQSGLLHKAMKKVLPKACYIGFTGTPLLKKEKSSFAKFGGEIHRYTIDEAIRDRAVLPLLYEGRLAAQTIKDSVGLNRTFDIITKDLNQEEKSDLQKKWVRFSKIASSAQRLELIAFDIYAHFKKYLAGTGFKAILATSSKYEAIKYYEIFEEHYKDIKTAYVISNTESSEIEEGNKAEIAKKYQDLIQAYGDEERYMHFIYDEFVQGDGLSLLIVVDKLLTGFDAPRASVMYVDKALKEHNLLQAIARVNRLCEGKDFGLIIDYRGLLGELDKALSAYSSLGGFDENDLKNAVIDVRTKIVEAKVYYEKLEQLFSDVVHKNDIESYINALADKDKRDTFKAYLSCLARAFEVALCSEKTESILNENEIKTFKQKIKFYNEVRQNAQIRYHEALDFNQYEKQMQKLLDRFINVEGVNELTRLVNIFESEFDDEVLRLQGSGARADAILNAIGAEISQKMQSNPRFYESLARYLQKIIDEYNQKRLSDEEKLKKAHELKEMLLKQGLDEHYPSDISNQILKAFYDNLQDLLELTHNARNEAMLCELCLQIYAIYQQGAQRPEWQNNKTIENEITAHIQNLLWDLEDSHNMHIQDKERICKVLRQIAISYL